MSLMKTTCLIDLMKKRIKKCLFYLESTKVNGFTFVETLVVLAIGAVVSAGTYLSAVKMIETAKRITAKNQISQYSSALHSYFLDCGRFPTTEQGLEALWEKPVLFPVPDKWDGPYLEKKISIEDSTEKEKPTRIEYDSKTLKQPIIKKSNFERYLQSELSKKDLSKINLSIINYPSLKEIINYCGS